MEEGHSFMPRTQQKKKKEQGLQCALQKHVPSELKTYYYTLSLIATTTSHHLPLAPQARVPKSLPHGLSGDIYQTITAWFDKCCCK